MIKTIFYIFFFCLFLAKNLFADQLIIEPEMGRRPIKDMMMEAKHSLHLVMYGFTDKELLQPLLKQKQYGRNIKIILEQSPYRALNENKKTIRTLELNHIDWQGTIPPFQFIHQKTLLVDGKKALVMTFNFTKSSFRRQRNFALIIDEPEIIKTIDDIFSADWNHQPSALHSPSLIVSPDNSRNILSSLLENAHTSIKIYAQSITDYSMVGTIAKVARRGIPTEIITSASLRSKPISYLEKSGVKIHQSHHYYIHAKVFIIDDKIAIIGSINLTQPSLDNNRELAVITRDPDIIRKLNTTFRADWNN